MMLPTICQMSSSCKKVHSAAALMKHNKLEGAVLWSTAENFKNDLFVTHEMHLPPSKTLPAPSTRILLPRAQVSEVILIHFILLFNSTKGLLDALAIFIAGGFFVCDSRSCSLMSFVVVGENTSSTRLLRAFDTLPVKSFPGTSNCLWEPGLSTLQ